jgi:uncharacterized membrane protein YbhN (UPF0104 family)
MRGKLKRWWPALKAMLAVAILLVIGRRFVMDLARPEIHQRSLHPGWLALSAFLYLLGIGLSACFWRMLLAQMGAAPAWLVAFRGYFVGNLGKYLPGKAMALWMRAEAVHGAGPGRGLAALTAFYEVLTTMASGALLAACVFLLEASAADLQQAVAIKNLIQFEPIEADWLNSSSFFVFSLALASMIGVVLLPPIFNRLVHFLSLPFRDAAAPAPQIHFRYLFEGFVLTSVGWLCLGASTGAAINGVVDANWHLDAFARITGAMAFSYVCGFVILVAPGGLGVREFILALLLAPELSAMAHLNREEARAASIVVVLVLRLVWTSAELAAAAALYWLPVGIANKP